MAKGEQYGADGNLARATRTVIKGGIVKFDNNKYQDNRLLLYVGERVIVVFNGQSSFADGPVIVKIGYDEICEIEASI